MREGGTARTHRERERESFKTHKNYPRIDVKLKAPKPTNYYTVLKPMNHNKFILNKLKIPWHLES